MEVCAGQDTVANGLMNLRLTTGKDLIGKCSGELIIRPDGLETVFVEETISFANTEVVLVFWEVRKLLGKVYRGWICGARWIEGERCRQGALKCSGFRFVKARSGVSANREVEDCERYGTRRKESGCRLRLAIRSPGTKKHHVSVFASHQDFNNELIRSIDQGDN